MILKFLKSIFEVVQTAIKECQRPTENRQNTALTLKNENESSDKPSVSSVPVINYPVNHKFEDYLFRAMRDVPDICNLQSCHSANNIHVVQTGQSQYIAKLYKKDSQREIRKIDFNHEIQPWLNNSLETVRFLAEEDVKELQQQHQMNLLKLNQIYNLNCSKSPQQQQEFWIQYQSQYQNELYHYHMRLQSIQHLLCTVSVVDLTDCGFYVTAVFDCNNIPRIPLC